MKDKFLPWFLLFCALGLSATAGYYSVVGLSIVFAGVAIPVIIMGSFLEISKLAIATYLHDKWKETYGALKIYMTMALIILSIITSLGIYGLLSTGFQENIAKLEINDKKIKNVEVKKDRFIEIKNELTNEKTTLDKDITQLRSGLSNNTTTQSVDRNTGQLITRANNANRRSFEIQLKDAQTRRDTLSSKIDALNDSITNIDIQILDMESDEISGNELGTIKYVSEILNWEIKETANIFILILIFVFDPLAITLVIATNQAFKSRRKEEVTAQVTAQDTAQDTAQVDDTVVTEKPEKEIWDRVRELREKGKFPEKEIWDRVRELRENGKLPELTDEEIEDEPTALAFTPYDETNDVEDIEVDNIIETEEDNKTNNNIKRLTYTKNVGNS
jgi:hypothetical protein